LRWDDSHVEDCGDGLLIFLPPDTQNRRVVEGLPNELAGRLREHNAGAAIEARIRLRMVFHAGEVVHDEQGVSSSAAVLASRLLNAAALKAALAESRGVLALITSTAFFNDVVSSYPAANPDIYWQVSISEKETNTTAWICLPDNYLLPGDDAESSRAMILSGDVKRRHPIVRPVPENVSPPLPVDLFGRDEDLARLSQGAMSALGGRGAAVLVSGEPGIGKTSLLDVVATQCLRLGMRVLRGAAEELEVRFPFAAIGSCLGIAGTSTDRAVQRIAELIRGESASGAGASSGAVSQEYVVVEAILTLMDDWCAETPVALFLDDLQWADPASLRVLSRIGRVIGQLPLFVGTSCLPVPRSDELAGLLRSLDAHGAQSIALGPLPGPAVEGLVARLVRARPGPDLLAVIQDTAGNPLYISELVTSLIREHQIRISDGVAELTERDDLAVPASLADAIRHHMSVLSPQAQHVLPVAAALGTGFSVTELSMVLNEPLSSLLGIIREASQVGLLIDADNDLIFRHDVTRRVLADSLPESAHLAIHARAGHALAAAHAPIERVAEHLLQGAVMDVAALDWLTASAEALAVRAPTLAVDLLRHALSLADPGDRRQAVLRVHLCRALQWAGQAAEAEVAIHDALARDPEPAQKNVLRWLLALACFAQGKLAETLEECESALAAGRLTAAETTRFQGQIAQCHLVLSNFDEAMVMAGRARQTAIAGGVEWSAIQAVEVMTAVYLSQQRSEQALHLADQELSILASYEEIHPDLPFGIAPYMLKGWSLTELDRLAEADETLETGMRFCERTGSPLLAMYHATRATLRFLQGRWDDALAEIRAGQEIPDPLMVAVVPLDGMTAVIGIHRNDRAVIAATNAWPEEVPPSMAFAVFWNKWARALAAEAAGNPERAFDLLFTYWDRGTPLPRAHMHHICPDLARLAVVLGKPKLATRVADEMTTLSARETKSAAIQGTAALCRGMAEGDIEQLRTAVAAYRQAGRPLYQAHAYENAAVFLAKSRRTSQAHAALKAAVDLYTGLDATWDVDRARQRIRQTGIRVGTGGLLHRPKTGWDALTPTERTVATLVAQGHSNPAIAAQMPISRRTVQSHVSSILSKLGLTSRVELAEFVTTHERTDPR
jgi:DNA-binding NarL/FixJ family response regulator/tetratricopeptide (TPR) repeat protein